MKYIALSFLIAACMAVGGALGWAIGDSIAEYLWYRQQDDDQYNV